ncbi:mycofactocin-coupled SDR family oxidoreductase [Nocardia sp. NPDC051030]|uniref:mycofactocin-coupled SDR family oxidoreductase n=1 Tax=Nocardia sp. NPDC051030 TaxID=3155162 RepID=UPI003417EF40
MGRVEGKVVAITGAGRGQGRSHAVRLAEEGADIIALDACTDIDLAEYPMATPEDLAETAQLVEKTGRKVFTKQVDVRDRPGLQAAFAEGVAELGRLDVVIPNAGISVLGADRPVTAFADTVDINLGGVFNTVHAALPHLGAGASIILIGSMVGMIPDRGEPGPMGPGGLGYSMAKSTLIEYGNTLAVLLAPHNQRVNIVVPTSVDTDMIQNDAIYRLFRPDLDEPGREDAVSAFTGLQGIPIPWVEPVDVSHAITFLASDESRYVTGVQLKIDGGALLKRGVW